MKVEIRRIYVKKNINKNFKVKYDKTSKKRPAWIWIQDLPKNVAYISVRVNQNNIFYKTYLSSKIPLFLPSNYTKEEMRKYYDKFSGIYDNFIKQNNLPAAKFLLKKFKLPKNAKILDLGAGTGLTAIPFVNAGYKDITLLDYSKKMLEKAKKKKELAGCRFLHKDITKFNLKEKFDLIISIFSFASNSYFDEKDMPLLWKKVFQNLKPKGTLALMGYDYEPPKVLFRKIKKGKYNIIKDYWMKWYIGKKK